jgi:hypothetical protein
MRRQSVTSLQRGKVAMRTRLLMGFVVSTAWVIWTADATQTLGAPDPAAEQLSYTSVFDCDGCVGGPTLTRRISILVDVDDTTAGHHWRMYSRRWIP